jgi:hypothetical protein
MNAQLAARAIGARSIGVGLFALGTSHDSYVPPDLSHMLADRPSNILEAA